MLRRGVQVMNQLIEILFTALSGIITAFIGSFVTPLFNTLAAALGLTS
jgi:hypothetical protein